MFPSGTTVAIIEGDTILLTLRHDFEVWCLPGGELDDGESLAEAARREVREETGLDVELTRLVGMYSRVGWRPHHDFLFAGQISGGTLAPDPHEVLEARFFPFDALPEYFLMGQETRIQDAISGVTGCVKTERVTPSGNVEQNRAAIYRERDESGLSPRDFYRAKFGLLKLETQTDVAGYLP
ncbi:MAG: NUDIX domain-containing protein [Chloroflexi bacterium]|nr:NUDIX domain-containing protein [Chloroflexota bacterium]